MFENHDVLDARQAAAYLRLNAQTVRRLARQNLLPAFKVGGSWRFRKSSLDRCAESQHRPPRKQGHILVVDDEQAVLDFVRHTLEREGFRVSTAAGGAEALELVRQEAPDLVVLDLKMPGMDGPTTLKEIRKAHAALPVIIITGYPDSDLMAEALRYSPVLLLPKPVPPRQLLEAVRLVLREGDTERS